MTVGVVSPTARGLLNQTYIFPVEIKKGILPHLAYAVLKQRHFRNRAYERNERGPV